MIVDIDGLVIDAIAYANAGYRPERHLVDGSLNREAWRGLRAWVAIAARLGNVIIALRLDWRCQQRQGQECKGCVRNGRAKLLCHWLAPVGWWIMAALGFPGPTRTAITLSHNRQ